MPDELVTDYLEAKLLTKGRQALHIPLAVATKTEVSSDVDGTQVPQTAKVSSDKLPIPGLHDGIVKANGRNLINSERRQRTDPVVSRQEPRLPHTKHLGGVGVKGHGNTACTAGMGILHAGANQRTMPKMDAIERADTDADVAIAIERAIRII